MKHTLFIIFGSTGDLAKRYLFPALYEVARKDSFSDIDILAVGRRDFSDDVFRKYVDTEASNFIRKKSDFWEFLQSIHYQKVEVTKKSDYNELAEAIHLYSHSEIQIVIYLSIAPDFFTDFIEHSQVLKLPDTTRVVFEKPFWTDLQTSRALNIEIEKVFQEKQIYRIDHYLGKEAMQNIFALRFANTIFEPIWNNEHIDNIQITASESLGVWSRGWYYDSSWALRDMVQNHLLQALSLVTMEPPIAFKDQYIQEEKLKVFRALKLDNNFSQSVVFGQYTWYLSEDGVAPDSRTETFIALKLEVANTRWEWVPIYLKTGKSLDRRLTQIVIEFKETPYFLFQQYWVIERNRIIIDIQPDETIRIEFNVKENGSSKTRKVQWVSSNNEHGKEAYEKLLEDVIKGDKTLFTSFAMLEETWRIIDDLVNCKDNCPMIYPYTPWSIWPELGNTLLERDNRSWYVTK